MSVTPAEAGVHNHMKKLDSGSLIGVRDRARRNDGR